jgi:hypothetical protein
MKDLDKRSRETLAELLNRIPILKVEALKSAPTVTRWNPDFIVETKVSGKPHSLICEVKANGQPRFVSTAILQLRDYISDLPGDATPILIAPYLSSAARQLCREKSVGYLDLEGNCWIAFDGVFIDHQVADRPAKERRELKFLFKPKSARIMHTMLQKPKHAWRVVELSEAAGASLGQVSNVRKALLDREWAETTKEGVQLSDPAALLDAWVEVYEPPVAARKTFYTTLHGSALQEAVRSALSDRISGSAVLSSFSAAQWLASYARINTTFFYANSEGLEKLIQALKLAPASKGENVVINVSHDEDLLLDTVEPAPGILCTSPVQTYLDLSVAGERGKEAAEHLREETLIWPL